MNEALNDRFSRGRKGARAQPREEAQIWILPQQLNPKVREYFEDAKKPVEGGDWLRRPEIPTSAEILDMENAGSSSSDVVMIVPNKIQGAWQSKEAYLAAHYELLREDAIRPLREAVAQVRTTPSVGEDAYNNAVGLYDKVHICGITCSTRGIAIRVTFSLALVGKKIIWEQSKRLITGSLVVLLPKKNVTGPKAVVAIVAARPLSAVTQNPPEVDLFIARPEEQELDPAQEWLMVEDRGGLYEANRHTLLALQKMVNEPFPLSEHLVDVERVVGPPQYIESRPKADLTPVLINNKQETYENVHLLKGWPSSPTSELDASQLEALQRILTQQLSIVQGPPGTGKTFVSVQAIRLILQNRAPDDPPIIIACQTNHAVDQILRHIAEFEQKFIRLGGRSKDKDVVKNRTLQEVRKQTSENTLAGCLAPKARRKMKDFEKEFGVLLAPLKPHQPPLDFRLLQKFGLITEKQADTLEAGASQWVQDQHANPNDAARSPFTVWLGDALVTVPPKQQPEDHGFDFEPADLEFEQLRDMEAENVTKEDDDFETLSGETFPVADNFTCRKVSGMTDQKVKDALRQQDLWKIPEAVRPAVYRYLQAEAKKVMLKTFRERTNVFNDQATKRRIGRFEQDEVILKTQHIIGMTTTGLSKYRGLLAALKPKIVLIEEAAETLEAPVTVACLPSLQHLILVGDHLQLRPHCHVRAHENKPYYLNISLFERLVNNGVEYSALAKQRRMVPEIRRLLYPIYKNLIKDHASVLDANRRPAVPGMGGVNSWFFTHEWPEQRDQLMSSYNPEEADMIVKFYEYLYCNSVGSEDITVLTFYNGQRKRILSELRKSSILEGQSFKVVTVDSYQGEENKIVLLSLVRSNDKSQIGFLENTNRVCVALSRAMCGFYIFGNGLILYNHKIWKEVLMTLANRGHKKDRLKIEPLNRLAENMPLRCVPHGNLSEIATLEDWRDVSGGCVAIKCGDALPCGHPCTLMCHPFSHDVVNCPSLCGKMLPCGHECQQACAETCMCERCGKKRSRGDANAAPVGKVDEPSEKLRNDADAQPRSNSASWWSYAEAEKSRHAEATASRTATPVGNANTKKMGHVSKTASPASTTNPFKAQANGSPTAMSDVESKKTKSIEQGLINVAIEADEKTAEKDEMRSAGQWVESPGAKELQGLETALTRTATEDGEGVITASKSSAADQEDILGLGDEVCPPPVENEGQALRKEEVDWSNKVSLLD